MSDGNLIDIKKLYDEALKRRGRVNLIVAGRTGVGKSTLINAVFGGDFAETGQGRPVSPGIKEITKWGVPIRILDTRGLEQKDYEATRAALEAEIRRRRDSPNPSDHIHAAWLCISEDSRRVEQSESDLCALLDRLGVPPIAVITKARQDGGFASEVAKLLPEARNVVRVRAVPETYDDGHSMPAMGVDHLVSLTSEVVPEGQHQAFAAAQKVSRQLKAVAARKVVAGAAAAAAAAGAIPIPFSDAAVLVPIQVGMLAGISLSYGLQMTEGFLSTLISSVVGAGGASVVGRAIVGGLLKLIPGAGSIVGGTIAAATASTLTTVMGLAYIAAIEAVFKEGGEFSALNVARHFRDQLERQRLD